MLEKPQFNTQGEKIVCTQDTVHPEMLQDIRVYRMKKGQELTFGREDGETAILLTEGTVLPLHGMEIQQLEAEKMCLISRHIACISARG